jgi:hypothetical protein
MSMPSTPQTAAGDARVTALAGQRLLQITVIGAAMTVIFTLSMLSTAFLTTSEAGPRTLDMDFRVFWAAARLVVQGEPLAAFDMARLADEHGFGAERWMPWVYPPGYMYLIAPFGLVSFATAFLASTVLSLGLIALALRPFVAGNRVVWLAMALSPAFIAALVIGQNSLIWLACLLAAIAALRDQRWVLAGVVIGCLTLKPQLGVLIAVALLAAGLWRTIFAATATALVLAVLPTLAAGLKYWPMFFDRVSEQGDRLLGAIGATDLMVGTFYLMVRLGLPAELALTVQTGLALACVFAVAFVWRSGRVSLDTKAAALLAAIFLSAPYLWFYEAALMAATGLFLLRAGLIRQTPQHLALLFLLWLGAGIQAITVFLGQGDSGFPWAVIYVPVMATALVLCLLQLRSQPQPEPLAG